MSAFSSPVWKRANGRTLHHAMSERSFIAAVTGFTGFGLIVSAITAYFTLGWQPSLMMVLLVGLVIPIGGIFLALMSDDWIVSLIGYMLVVTGLGAIIGPTVNMYETGVVMNALIATAGVTLVMSITGIVYPKLLIGWGGYLFGALIALVFVRMGQMFMAGFGISAEIYDWPFMDYAAAVLFSLYIIYDWNRAMHLPRTLNNAVDVAVAIYLDIANLFLNLLRIFGGGGSKS